MAKSSMEPVSKAAGPPAPKVSLTQGPPPHDSDCGCLERAKAECNKK